MTRWKPLRSTSPPTVISTWASAGRIQPGPHGRAVQGAEALQVHPVTHHLDLARGGPEGDRQPGQGPGDREQAIGIREGLDQAAPLDRIAAMGDLGAAQGDGDRLAQPAAEAGGRIAVRVGEVGVDDIEAVPPSIEQGQAAERHHPPVAPAQQPGQRRKAGETDLEPLLLLDPRGWRAIVRPDDRTRGSMGEVGRGETTQSGSLFPTRNIRSRTNSPVSGVPGNSELKTSRRGADWDIGLFRVSGWAAFKALMPIASLSWPRRK